MAHPDIDPEPVEISIPAGYLLVGSFRHLDIRCDEMMFQLNDPILHYCGAFVPRLIVSSAVGTTSVRIINGRGRRNASTPATGFRFVFSFETVGIISLIQSFGVACITCLFHCLTSS